MQQLIFAIATLIFVQPLCAANETFSYTDGPLLGQGGTGVWAGSWETLGSDPQWIDPWQVQSESLLINPVVPENPLDPMSGTGTSSYVERDLAVPVTSSSVYLSFQITPGDMGHVYDASLYYPAGSNSITVGFADTNAGGPMITTYRYQEGIDLGPYDEGPFIDGFGISFGGFYDWPNSIGTWTQGLTYRLVGRLSFDAQGQQEQWSVWIDPFSEADSPAGSITGDLGYSQISKASLYQYVDYFESMGSSMIDDLRIGETWESVTSLLPSSLMGDLNDDGFIGIADLNIILSHWNENAGYGNPQLGDLTRDGFVGIDDLNIVLGNWNAGTPPVDEVVIPEPGALLIAGLGLLATLCGSRVLRHESRSTRQSWLA